MKTLLRTWEFDAWLRKLHDPFGKARVLARLRSAALGNFGDNEPVGEGVYEMRVHAGPGYRVYYTHIGQSDYVMLCGGDKASQRNDIRRARELASEFKDGSCRN